MELKNQTQWPIMLQKCVEKSFLTHRVSLLFPWNVKLLFSAIYVQHLLVVNYRDEILNSILYWNKIQMDVWFKLNKSISFIYLFIYKKLHEAPSSRTTLGNSLTLSPSMEDRFKCAKVIRTEGLHRLTFMGTLQVRTK